jgi:hypothetical protein
MKETVKRKIQMERGIVNGENGFELGKEHGQKF